jgi:hypothetical protein
MKAVAVCVFGSLLAASIGAPGSSRAAGAGAPTGSPAAVLGALAGTAVPAAELGKERARGAIGIDVNGSGSAITAGTSTANAVIGSPINGVITNDHSINNDTGITSVLQNFGNNSIMQVSTTINITLQH